MLPEIQIPEVHSFDALLERARAEAKEKTPRAALAVPSEPDTLRAFVRAASDGLISPIIIGDQAKLKRMSGEECIDVSHINVLDINQPDMAVKTAARMADAGEIDMIVQGRILAADLLSALMEKEQNFTVKGQIISHVAVLKPKKYPRLLMLTDGAVVPQPDLKTKLSLIANLARVSQSIGIDSPRVAVIGAVEVIYPQMQATMEAAILAKMYERGQIKGARVDGPLSFDVSVDMLAAHSKGVTKSEVAGQADAMLAPSIEVANGIYHAMSLYGSCETAGVVIGGRVPVAVNSRTDSEPARYNSIALAVLNV